VMYSLIAAVAVLPPTLATRAASHQRRQTSMAEPRTG